MSQQTTAASSRQHRVHKVERVRRYLAGEGVVREEDGDDDEPGYEDHPWEWIYATREPLDTGGNAMASDGDVSDSSGDKNSGAASTQKSRRSRGSRNGSRKHEKKIIGARTGQFHCKIGDCVLLKAEGTSESWVGIICEFLEDEEDEKVANFMWFSTQKEIRNSAKKRLDFLQNELYISPSWDLNPLASINSKATVMSAEAFATKYPNGKVPRSSKGHGKTFICRRGCNTRTTTYTEEFVWEDIYDGTEDGIHQLIDRVKSDTRTLRKKRTEKRSKEEDNFSGGDEADHSLQTPRKKAKLSTNLTPSKQRTPSKLLTPSQKRRVILKKPLEFTPLGTRILSPSHLYASPFQAARSKLHVSSVPAALPCREDEFASVYTHLEAAISDGSGVCIYISGTPGTGKTATVREVVAQLNASVMADELDDFIFVEINGMKVTDPHQSYSLLWEAMKGDRVSPAHAVDLLEREFSHPSPRRIPCVVLMDELDQLVTKNQSVMYNFFNWPNLKHSRLIVLAVANTMDLPERTLSNKISSRLGLTRITFPGYSHEQLMKIIQSRLEDVPGSIVELDAVQFASRKVAAVSGDARRALDICRRAVELAETENSNDTSFPETPTKTAKSRHVTMSSSKSIGKVTIATVKRAINEATASPLQRYLRCLPLSSKLLLAALLAKTRRTGLAESIIGDVLDEAKRMARMDIGGNMVEFLQHQVSASTKNGDVQLAAKQFLRTSRVLSMGASAIELMESGIIGLEARKADRSGKIRLNIGEEDVKLAFKDDPEIRNLGF